MRVNVYAEEITNRVELVEKDGHTGVRFYLELPVTMPGGVGVKQVSGPFKHHPGDDDSAAVTFWGKQALYRALATALTLLDERFASRGHGVTKRGENSYYKDGEAYVYDAASQTFLPLVVK
jgi:hypothetical protein